MEPASLDTPSCMSLAAVLGEIHRTGMSLDYCWKQVDMPELAEGVG